MTTTNETKTERKIPEPRNGVDTTNLFATINAVAGMPELAKFQFRATNKWETGTHSKTTVNSYSGACADHTREKTFVLDTDHPAVLVGKDNGPTPVELLLIGLAGCLTAGIGNIAAARGVTLESVESTVEGNIDLMGLLGLDKEVRNGFQDMNIHFKIKGDAPAEELEKIVMQSRNRSAVYDVLTNGIPVSISVDAN